MSYCTPDDVRARLAPGTWPVPEGQTPPVTRTAADLSDAQLQEACDDASYQIDAAISKYTAVPVADDSGGNTPQPIRSWATSIAAYLATLTNRRGADLTPTDPVALRYANVLQQLTAVRDGKANLDLPPNVGPGAAVGAGTPANSYAGDLFDSGDFDLVPINPGWPYYPDVPGPMPGIPGGATW